MSKKNTPYQVAFYCSIVLFVFSFLYVSVKIVLANIPAQGLDFRLIWLAGKLWLEGKNPYDNSVFQAAYLPVFGVGPNTHFWVYPPSWSLISTVFGMFPFSVAESLWRLFNYLALLGIVAVSGLMLHHWNLFQWNDARFYMGATYLYLLQATSVVISIGQTTILSTFGFMLTIYGIGQSSLPLAVLGMYIVALKPQLAFAFFVSLMAVGYYRLVFLAVLLTMFSSEIAFLSTGITANIQGFLDNLNRYSTDLHLSANLPPDLTGLVNLLDYLIYPKTISLSPRISVVISILLGLVIGFLMRRYQISFSIKDAASNYFNQRREIIISWIMTVLSSIYFLTPLHSYDAVLLGPIGIFSLYLRRAKLLFLIPILLLIMRAGNIAQITGIHHPGSKIFRDSLIVSLSSFILLNFMVFITAKTLMKFHHSQNSEFDKGLDSPEK
ncbi:MAG: hypothetical protein B0A82_15275 [Alkalinema sp. CACIAM 70d]|nr:MAG: hypothetical protein B0A82_15275 [Alkalinema sp. CACIAM 70d]